MVSIATGDDASNKFGVLPVTKDEHAMAVERVRHIGDLVACVAAEDEATALEAVRLINVEYEVLESIHDMKDGLKDSKTLSMIEANTILVKQMFKKEFFKSLEI